MTETALVTGSSSGFGRRTWRSFLAEGWNVVATLRDPAQRAGDQSDRHRRLRNPDNAINGDLVSKRYASGTSISLQQGRIL